MVGQIGSSYTTDHKELTMEFVDGGKQIFFQGDPHSVDVKLSKSGLRRLIARGVPNYFFHLRSEDPTSEEVKPWFEMIEVL